MRALHKYREVKGALPTRIFFYRDGVGEGQISHVIQHEVNRLKETVRHLAADFDPKITFVIGNGRKIDIRTIKK